MNIVLGRTLVYRISPVDDFEHGWSCPAPRNVSMKMATAFARSEITSINHRGGGTPYSYSGTQVYCLIICSQHRERLRGLLSLVALTRRLNAGAVRAAEDLCRLLRSGNRIRHREAAELCEAVKRQEVGIVSVVGVALPIVKRGAAGGDDVLAVEQPVHILKTVLPYIGMVE